MPPGREDVARAVTLVEDGRSFRYVAWIIGALLGSIHRAMQCYRELGTYNRRLRSSCRRSTSAKDDRFLSATSA
ncbi:hypothetical protein ANN_01464 [Periplaneta americana]|uniref:Uncharacterized protein n=1 Tax=Periplaneta americana TaxID=6978 RepID=A0ABQ8TTL6_PERAM|nr:hypothetical protein ANN_01464 [Periplaneta americana]